MVEKATIDTYSDFVLAVSTAVRSQERAPPNDEGRSDEDLRIRIFESILPNTDERLTAMLNPTAISTAIAIFEFRKLVWLK